MANRKIQSFRRYVLAFIIGTTLFLLGFFIVNSLSHIEYQRISDFNNKLSYKIFEDKISYSFFGRKICSDETYRSISEDLSIQGRIIDDLERKFGKENAKVLERKKFYSLVLLEHFEFITLKNEECPKKIHTILFFYSNDPRYLEDSENVGRVLSSVYERNNDLVIYSFDINLDSDLINKLKERYYVQFPLEIIIDEHVKILNVKDIEEIERHLD